MSEQRNWTGFTDRADRPIYEGDVVMFTNDEGDNSHGLIVHVDGKSGYELHCAGWASNREKGNWPLAQAIEEMGELEIVSTPDAPDYKAFVEVSK